MISILLYVKVYRYIMYTNFHMRVWLCLDYRLKVENDRALSLTQKLNTILFYSIHLDLTSKIITRLCLLFSPVNEVKWLYPLYCVNVYLWNIKCKSETYFQKNKGVLWHEKHIFSKIFGVCSIKYEEKFTCIVFFFVKC